MEHRHEIQVVTRENGMGEGESRVFQAKIVPNGTLAGKDLVKRFAERADIHPMRAKTAIDLLEGFILDQLAEGNRLDFGLVTFYPRLSEGLSTRDADPESEGVYVRGAVKARTTLVDALRKKLEPVNRLSNVRPRLFGVCDAETKEPGVVSADRVLEITGRDIPIDTSRADEGVWLASRTTDRVVVAEVLESTPQSAKCVFRNVPEGGKRYRLVVGTRCGKDASFKVRRCLADVRGK